MALLKFGGGIADIRGSIAGNVYSRNRFGSYARNRTKPVNTQTTLQSTVRGGLAYLTDLWHSGLDASQRTSWETYAAAVSWLNKLGETVHLTGFNMFVRSNSVRKQVGLAVIEDGPTTLSLPETDPSFAISASKATQKISVTYNHALPWSDEEGGRMHVYMGRPKLVTRNYFSGPWRLTGNIANGGDGSDDLDPAFTLVQGQKIWCYARIDRIDGRLSNPMVASCTVGA
jgi:hypothetical protein